MSDLAAVKNAVRELQYSTESVHIVCYNQDTQNQFDAAFDKMLTAASHIVLASHLPAPARVFAVTVLTRAVRALIARVHNVLLILLWYKPPTR